MGYGRCYSDWCNIGSINDVGGTWYISLEVLVRLVGHGIYQWDWWEMTVLVGLVGHGHRADGTWEILMGLAGHGKY